MVNNTFRTKIEAWSGKRVDPVSAEWKMSSFSLGNQDDFNDSCWSSTRGLTTCLESLVDESVSLDSSTLLGSRALLAREGLGAFFSLFLRKATYLLARTYLIWIISEGRRISAEESTESVNDGQLQLVDNPWEIWRQLCDTSTKPIRYGP